MTPAHIAGKNPSILTYPEGFFRGINSYGLNDGAIIAGTDYAITGHEQFLEPLREAGYTGGKLICTDPLYEGTRPPADSPTIIFKPDPRAVAVREVDQDHMAVHVGYALRGNRERGYPNYWTVLHHAIFWLILEGHREIHLHGCNLTPGKVNEAAVPLKHGEYCRRHTRKLVDACNSLGVKVLWHDNYQKYAE